VNLDTRRRSCSRGGLSGSLVGHRAGALRPAHVGADRHRGAGWLGQIP